MNLAVKRQDIDGSLGRKYGGLQTPNCVLVKCGVNTESGEPEDLISVCREGWRVRAPHDGAKSRARVGHVPFNSGHECPVVEGIASVGQIRRQRCNTVTENSEAVALETRRPH